MFFNSSSSQQHQMNCESAPQTNSRNLITHLVTHIILHTTVITVAFLTAGVNTCQNHEQQQTGSKTKAVGEMLHFRCLDFWNQIVALITLSETHQNSNDLLWVVDHSPTDQLQGSRQKEVCKKKRYTKGDKTFSSLNVICLRKILLLWQHYCLKSSFLHCFCQGEY